MTMASGSASAMLESIRNGRMTVENWVQGCLDRIDAREAAVRAWAHISPEAVLAEARRLDADQPRGPLHGLPIGVKDVILTADLPTSYNSPIYADFRPNCDAACVKLLRAAGALVLGKTETVEFAAAMRLAPTHNPLDLSRTPGGSSSGSAAAVADNHVPVALGTQTGGSVIRPASYCGVFAFKPTWSRVSRDGIKMYSASLDTLGWFARSVEDLALLYMALTPDPVVLPLPQRKPQGLRIAICETPFPDRAEHYTQAGLKQAAETIAAAGIVVDWLTLPPEFDDIDKCHRVIMRAEGRTAFFPEYVADHDLLNDQFRELVENIDAYDDADLCAAHNRAAQVRQMFDEIASDYDAVLTYSVPGEAPLGLNNNGSADFNSLWTLLHVPCVNVPAFKGPNGLPVGLTVTGPRFADVDVLSIAETVHRLLDAA